MVAPTLMALDKHETIDIDRCGRSGNMVSRKRAWLPTTMMATSRCRRRTPLTEVLVHGHMHDRLRVEPLVHGHPCG